MSSKGGYGRSAAVTRSPWSAPYRNAGFYGLVLEAHASHASFPPLPLFLGRKERRKQGTHKRKEESKRKLDAFFFAPPARYPPAARGEQFGQILLACLILGTGMCCEVGRDSTMEGNGTIWDDGCGRVSLLLSRFVANMSNFMQRITLHTGSRVATPNLVRSDYAGHTRHSGRTPRRGGEQNLSGSKQAPAAPESVDHAGLSTRFDATRGSRPAATPRMQARLSSSWPRDESGANVDHPSARDPADGRRLFMIPRGGRSLGGAMD